MFSCTRALNGLRSREVFSASCGRLAMLIGVCYVMLNGTLQMSLFFKNLKKVYGQALRLFALSGPIVFFPHYGHPYWYLAVASGSPGRSKTRELCFLRVLHPGVSRLSQPSFLCDLHNLPILRPLALPSHHLKH